MNENDFDVVVVGSGIGGLAAAVTAADGGAKVVIVERSTLLGGVSGVSGGELWAVGTHVGADADIDDDFERGEEYLEFLSGGTRDKALQQRLLRGMPEAFRYFADRAGVRWALLHGAPDNFYPMAPGSLPAGRGIEVEPFSGAELGEWKDLVHRSPLFPPGVTSNDLHDWGGITNIANWNWEVIAQRMGADQRTFGGGLVGYFLKAALIDRSIPVRLSTRAESLVVGDDGRVVGVVCTGPDGPTTMRARRGVVLATGGYDWNTTLTDAYEQPGYHSACPPIVTGDHLTMAGEIGAQTTVLPPTGVLSLFGFHLPGEEVEGRPFWRYVAFEAGLPHAILVNRDGRRFCDESFVSSFGSVIREFDGKRRRYTNVPAYLILDHNHRSKYLLASFPPHQDLPSPPFVQADSLAELADLLGVDATGLAEAVKRYNDFAATGVDEDFGRGSIPYCNFFLGDPNCQPNPNLGPIQEPPFYGLELSAGGVGINAAGLRTDDCARVLHVRGHAIPGLYAVGNAAAQLDVGPAYQSGLTNTRGLVWGYVAGRHVGS